MTPKLFSTKFRLIAQNLATERVLMQHNGNPLNLDGTAETEQDSTLPQNYLHTGRGGLETGFLGGTGA